MKYGPYIILALFLSVSSEAAQKKPTKEWEALNGAVRTVRIESFVLSQTTGKEEPRYGATIYTYDTEGYKTKEDHLMADGSLSRQIFLTYDAQKRIAEKTDYLGTGLLCEETIYSYDNNNTVEVAVYESGTSLSYKVTFKFDPDYHLNDLSGLEVMNDFFRKGGWREAVQYDSTGSPLQKYTARDKDNGREIMFENLRNSTESHLTNVAKLVTIYDTNGNLTDRYLIVQDDTRLEIRRYNDRAEPKRPPKYEFDPNGNWTKKVFLSSGETHIEYRTITYY